MRQSQNFSKDEERDITLESLVQSIHLNIMMNKSSDWSVQQVEQILIQLEESMRMYLTRRRSIFNVLQKSESDRKQVDTFNSEYFGGNTFGSSVRKRSSKIRMLKRFGYQLQTCITLQ